MSLHPAALFQLVDETSERTAVDPTVGAKIARIECQSVTQLHECNPLHVRKALLLERSFERVAAQDVSALHQVTHTLASGVGVGLVMLLLHKLITNVTDNTLTDFYRDIASRGWPSQVGLRVSAELSVCSSQ
jgi:hypothetical protein